MLNRIQHLNCYETINKNNQTLGKDKYIVPSMSSIKLIAF